MESSCLGRLPPELRNTIYEHALYEPRGAEIWTEPGLLRTCSAIRAEAELMYYAINDFSTTMHEDYMNHDLCQWLQHKAGQRIGLIRALKINVEMPSIRDKYSTDVTAAEEEDITNTSDLGFFQLMHIIESIRAAKFRDLWAENIVTWTLNGAGDAETFQHIDSMSISDQDRYRGAKFLLLCMVHGEWKTVKALHAEDSLKALSELDEVVRRRRAGSVVPDIDSADLENGISRTGEGMW